MKNFSLYIITTEPKINQTYENMVEAAIAGGADIVQYRDVSSRNDYEKLQIIKKLKNITQKHNVPLIVNNRLDLAILGGADGVHVGQDDMPIEDIRLFTKNLKRDFIVGMSTHSIEQAKDAQKRGADYIGIGPVFATPTKPTYRNIGLDVAEEVFKTIKIPAVAIGGIDENNIDELIRRGINRVAVVRAVCGREDIKESALIIKKRMGI